VLTGAGKRPGSSRRWHHLPYFPQQALAMPAGLVVHSACHQG